MIYLNDNDLQELYVEDTEITKVYVGDRMVWGGNRIIQLGNGTSFDIASIYPNYRELTADNFFFVSSSPTSISGTSTATVHDSAYYCYITIWTGMYKTYNAQSGQLSWYQRNTYSDTYTAHSGGDTRYSTASMGALLVTKPEKLVYLGLGTRFDIKSRFPNDYQNMTVNNFIARDWYYSNGGQQGYISHSSAHYQGTWSGSATTSLIKSYNPSTGILTFYYNSAYSGDIGSGNVTSSLYVYYSKKAIV
jgi:hypothetical protein